MGYDVGFFPRNYAIKIGTKLLEIEEFGSDFYRIIPRIIRRMRTNKIELFVVMFSLLSNHSARHASEDLSDGLCDFLTTPSLLASTREVATGDWRPGLFIFGYLPNTRN